MSKQNVSTSRTIHKKTAMKNAAKFLALLIGFEVGLVMIFWLILIIVTSTDLYYRRLQKAKVPAPALCMKESREGFGV